MRDKASQRSFLIASLVAMFLVLPGVSLLSQEAEPETDTEATETESAAADAIDETTEDTDVELEVDDEYYGDVDDEDFLPSEDIPTDQSIAFPTDI